MTDILDDDVPGFKTSYLGTAPEAKTGVTVRAPTDAEMAKINKLTPDVGSLQPDLKERVDALRDLWKADKVLNPKGEDLPITSGFRTLEQQREEYKNRLKNPNLVAPPGHSRHEKGDALDIHPRVPDTLLEQVGLHRPYGAKDPVHVEINPSIEWNANPYDVEADTEAPGFQFKYNPKKVTAAEELGNVFQDIKKLPGKFAKQAASTADVALNVLPGMAQWALHPLAATADKFMGEQTEDQRTKLAKAAEDFTNPIGRAFGLLNDPDYKGEGARQIMDYVGEHADKGADWIAENTGMDKRDAQWWINAAAIKAAPTVGKGVVKVAEQIPNVGKGLANVVSSTLGAETGVGGDTVREAFKAGLHNRPEFWENLTGKADKTQVLQDAHAALQLMRNERLGTYADDALKVFDSPRIEAGKPLPKPQRLDFKPIDAEMKKMWESIQEHGEKGVKYKVGKEELPKIQEVQDIINEWKNDPSLHTVRGMDALKRRLDATYTENPKHSNAQRIITGMRNAVKNEIVAEVPEYQELMKNYEDSLDLEKEIERTLSLGPKANPETALRKLQSVTRNNVNTSYGYRGDIVRELEQRTGKNLISALSGQAMSTIQPRGLAGLNPIATLGAAYGLNPYALALLPTQSPGLVGALTYGAGKAVRKAGEMKTKLSEITSRK